MYGLLGYLAEIQQKIWNLRVQKINKKQIQIEELPLKLSKWSPWCILLIKN